VNMLISGSFSLGSLSGKSPGTKRTYEVIADGQIVYSGPSFSLAVALYRDLTTNADGGLVAIFLNGQWLRVTAGTRGSQPPPITPTQEHVSQVLSPMPESPHLKLEPQTLSWGTHS